MEFLLLLGALALFGGGKKPAGATGAANPTRLTPMDPGGSTERQATNPGPFLPPLQNAVPPTGGTDYERFLYVVSQPFMRVNDKGVTQVFDGTRWVDEVRYY